MGRRKASPGLDQVPTCAPDLTLDIPTRPDQAFIYRLCGDRDPLHSDPEFAKRAGFPRPILHGSATMGLPAAAFCKVTPITTLLRSSATGRDFLRRYIPARP